MKLKLVNCEEMSSLEEYLTFLVTGIMSLKTLSDFHVKAVEIGILKEDQECRSNTIIWDIKRLIKLYHDQADSILELLPNDYNFQKIVSEIAEEYGYKKNKKKKSNA